MKKLLFTLFIPLSLNAQTSLYESDDFIIDGWSVIETTTSMFGFNVDSNSGLLSISDFYTDTVRFSLVKGFVNISGLDSIEIYHNIVENPGSYGTSFEIQFFTSIDSINWTAQTTLNPPSIDSFMVYQSDLNTIGDTTYLRIDFKGSDYKPLPWNGFLIYADIKDIDITTVDMSNSIDELESDVKIFGDDGYIKIESESILESIDVFSLDGRLIYQNVNLNDYKATINIPIEGVYIININGICSKKIFIK